MKISREKLLNALEYVSPGLTAKQSTLEQSNCFAIQDGYIYTFNDEVATRTKSPVDITGAIQAGPLMEVLHRMKDEELDVSQKKSRLWIRGRNKKIWLLMEQEIALPIEDLDFPKKSKAWKPLPENFAEAIDRVATCASRDDSKHKLTYIHLNKEFVQAFDMTQFARFSLDLSPLKEDLCVKAIALKHISTMTMIEFAATDNWIHFRDAKKQIFSCRVQLDEYYNMDGHIAQAGGKQLALPKVLSEMSEESEIFSTDNQNPTDNFIEFNLKPGRVTISSEGTFGGYEGYSKKIKYKGKKIRVMILPKILRHIINHHSSCEVSKKALKAESGSLLFITALAKPKKAKKKAKKGKAKK